MASNQWVRSAGSGSVSPAAISDGDAGEGLLVLSRNAGHRPLFFLNFLPFFVFIFLLCMYKGSIVLERTKFCLFSTLISLN